MGTPWRARAAVTAVTLLASLIATASAPAALTINEIESNGGTPGDWVEIVNTGPGAADLGGYRFRDNDAGHAQYVLPAGTTLAPGAFYVVEEAAFGFGLGANDSATLWAPDGTTVVDSHAWTAHAATTLGRCPNATGAFKETASSTKAAANDCATPIPNVKVNEVESSGGSPGDWIELINNGATPADVGGFVVKDNDDAHVHTIAPGTTIAAGGYLVLEEAALGFGLGSADSARLFAADGATLVDAYTWAAHASTTYGRCPNGTGHFAATSAATKAAANLCAGDVPAAAWPGGSGVSFADDAGVFGGNISGLAYEASGTGAPGVLWVVKNGPSMLYRLVWTGTKWTPDTANGWSAGKLLRYADGTGDPDAEGVALVDGDPANGVFVATERNNSVNAVSRPAVLRFDVSSPATTLLANTDWNLTGDLPGLGANLGLEAIEWIPDAFLVSKGFQDQATNAPYDPSAYPGHGSGLFFVGVEQNGAIYAYALDQASGTFTRVATIASGFTGVMELEYEPETGHLWAVCDDTCNGRSATLDIAQSGEHAGRFVVTNVYERPAGMANLNNEGFAIAPQDECVDGKKPAFWTDDSNTESHAIRAGSLNCTVLVHEQTITFAQPPPIAFGSAPATLVATASSGLPVSFAASGPCTVTGTTLTVTGAGACAVAASQAGNASYSAATPVSRTVTITKAATALAQSPVSLVGSILRLQVRYSAVLTSKVTGAAIAGQTVTFGPATCRAVTDSAGRATCTTSVLGILGLLTGSTTARYAGSADYEATAATAPVRLA